MRHFTLADRLINHADQVLRTLTPNATAALRPNPANPHETLTLTAEQQTEVAGLMRVNHSGEVCAQALYHGQGLIPVKYLGVENGVNVTLGLPLIRTSPDHGTAFDIAGKGIADPSSLIAAIKMAKSLITQP